MSSPSRPSDNDLNTPFTPPAHEQWFAAAQAAAAQATESAPDNKLAELQYETLDGLTIQVLYDDNPILPESAALASMETFDSVPQTSAWDNRLCLIDTGDTSVANHAVHKGLRGGNTSVELHVDKHTDIAALLKDVLLQLAPVSFRTGRDQPAIARRFQSLVERQSLSPATLRCSFNADPLRQWLQTGIEPASVDAEFRTMAQFSQETTAVLPMASTILVDTALHHNAGASEVQELQAAIATGTLYLSHLLDAGMSLVDANRCMVFQMACDADVLMGCAKLRSLRVLWQHVLKQFGGPAMGSESAASVPALVVETSRRYLSRLDPWNNHLRNIAACSAAAMGGAQTIIVHPHDRIGSWQASTDPTIGVRMARNLPIILEREAWLTQVNDPFAGSYAVETLTAQLSDRTWQALADMGDLEQWLMLIRTGQWRSQLADTQQRRMLRLTREQQIVVGVNGYVDKGETDKIDEGECPSIPVSTDQTQKNTSSALRSVRDASHFERHVVTTQDKQS